MLYLETWPLIRPRPRRLRQVKATRMTCLQDIDKSLKTSEVWHNSNHGRLCDFTIKAGIILAYVLTHMHVHRATLYYVAT